MSVSRSRSIGAGGSGNTRPSFALGGTTTDGSASISTSAAVENIIDTDSRLKWLEQRLSATFRTPQIILHNLTHRNPNLVDTRRVFEDDDVRRDVTAFLDSDSVSALYAFTITTTTMNAAAGSASPSANNNNKSAAALALATGPPTLVLTANPSAHDFTRGTVKKILIFRKNLNVKHITVGGISKEISCMETLPAMMNVTNRLVKDVFRPLIATNGVDREKKMLAHQMEMEKERREREAARRQKREEEESKKSTKGDDVESVSATNKLAITDGAGDNKEETKPKTNGEEASSSSPIPIYEELPSADGSTSKAVRKHLLAELTKIANTAAVLQGKQDGIFQIPLPMQQHRDADVNIGTPAQQNAHEVERLAQIWMGQFKQILDEACPEPQPLHILMKRVKKIAEAKTRALSKATHNSIDGGGGGENQLQPSDGGNGNGDNAANNNDAPTATAGSEVNNNASVLRDDGTIAPPLVDLTDIPPNIMPLGIIYPLEEVQHWRLHAKNVSHVVKNVLRSDVFKRCVRILRENNLSEFRDTIENYVDQLDQHLVFVENTNKWLAPIVPYFEILAPRSGRTTLSFGTNATVGGGGLSSSAAPATTVSSGGGTSASRAPSTSANSKGGKGSATALAGVTVTTTADQLHSHKKGGLNNSNHGDQQHQLDDPTRFVDNFQKQQQIPVDTLIRTNYIAELFELLYLLWEHNEAYPSTSRMASMMVGIVEYVIVACTEHLDLEQTFLSEPKETLARIKDVFAVCAKVKSAMMWFKQKATAPGRNSIVSDRIEAETAALEQQQSNRKKATTTTRTSHSPSPANPNNSNNAPGVILSSGTKTWDVSHIQILSHMDQFLERCNDLVEILETRHLYNWLRSYDLTGVEGNALHDTINHYVDTFEEELKVGYIDEGAFEVMPHPCSKFDSLTKDYLLKFTRELETKICEGVSQYVSTAPMGISLTRHVYFLQRLLERPSAQSQQAFIIATLVKRWCDEMRTVKMILKESTVPLPATYTAFADAAAESVAEKSNNGGGGGGSIISHNPYASPFTATSSSISPSRGGGAVRTQIVLGVTQAQTTIYALSLCRRLYDLAAVMGDLLSLPKVQSLPGQAAAHKAALAMRDDIDDRVSAAFEDSFVIWARGLPSVLDHLQFNLLKSYGSSDGEGDAGATATGNAGGGGGVVIGSDFEVCLPPEVTTAIREVSILHSVISQPQVRHLFPNIEMPDEALQLLKMRDQVWEQHTGLLNNVEAFNGIRKSIVPHEKMLLAEEIEAVNRIFLKGTRNLRWDSNPREITKFNENCAAAVKSLETALKNLRAHVEGLRTLLKSLTTEEFHFLPLRNSRVGDKTLPLSDLLAKYDDIHSKRKAVMDEIKAYLAVLSQKALLTLNATECFSEQQAPTTTTLPTSETSILVSSSTAANKGGSGGSSSLPTLAVSFAPSSSSSASTHRRRAPLTENSPDWKHFLQFVDDLVSKEIRDFLSFSLQTIRRQLDAQWLRENDGLPLLQSQLHVDEREGGIRVTPDLHTESHLVMLRLKEDPFGLVANIMPTRERQHALNVSIQRDILISKREVMISRGLEDTWKAVTLQISNLSKFEELYSPTMIKDIEKRLNTGDAAVYKISLDQIVEQIGYYQQLSRKVAEITNIRIILGWMRLDFRAAKATLHKHCKDSMQMYVKHVHESIKKALDHARLFSQRAARVFDTDLNSMDTDDSAAVKKIFKLIRDVKDADESMKAIFQPIIHGLRLLNGWGTISREEFEQLYEEMGVREPEWTATVNKSVGVKEQLAGVYDREVETLHQRVKRFEAVIAQEREELLALPIFTSTTHLEDPYTDLEKALSRWQKEIKITADELLGDQRLFEVEFSNLESVAQTIEDIQACKQFWDGAFLALHHSTEWMEKPFIHVDTTLLVDETRKISRYFALGLPRETRQWHAFTASEKRLNRIISSIPLIQDLRTGALRRRHWDQLLDLCENSGMGTTTKGTSALSQQKKPSFAAANLNTSSTSNQKNRELGSRARGATTPPPSNPNRIDPMSASTTLGDLLNLNLHHHSDAVTKLVERAEKELQIETILDKIDAFWAQVKLPSQSNPHQHSQQQQQQSSPLPSPSVSTVILGPSDALRETLEEHINLVQTTQASRWGDYFRPRAKKLNHALQRVDIVLTLWNEGQKIWDALFPIFVQSLDMRRALPDDVKAFDAVNLLFATVCQTILGTSSSVLLETLASPSLLPEMSDETLSALNMDEASHAEIIKNVTLFVKSASSANDASGGDDDENEKDSGEEEGRENSHHQHNNDHYYKRTIHYHLEVIVHILQRCNASLATYLEAKRRLFPRFFFVSDADLITIFAKAEYPPIVCGFIGKLCDAVSKCVFDETVVASGEEKRVLNKKRRKADEKKRAAQKKKEQQQQTPFVFGAEPTPHNSDDGDDDCDDGQEDDSHLRLDTILSVISVEGEALRLPVPFVCSGAVEVWLSDLIEAIRDAVRAAVVIANSAYIETPRQQWMFQHITQAVCVVSRAHWTSQSTAALEAVEDGNLSALSDHGNLLKQQLVGTIETVGKNLSPLERKGLFTLITLDVHARDIIFELIAKRIDSTTSFSWQKVLRFYFENPQAHVSLASPLKGGGGHSANFSSNDNASFATAGAGNNNNLNHKETMLLNLSDSDFEARRSTLDTLHGMANLATAEICDTAFQHGFEYIGNCGCLVVTPLTDRCYITLTQALKLFKGGAPAGPAGTGKTETVKDIARTLGFPVYVFNCSEQMDYLSVGNIFKGLAMSGAWGCFDEFNRIAIEVLSVVAAQVKAILDACAAKSSHFSILGAQLTLKPSVGIFVTMNPGYKGRTELPENVKALFRPCAMVVPDLESICEIYLSAEGFVMSRELSKKFVRLYQLNKELLSPEDHYDWGLRAIRAVLAVAGQMKRSLPAATDERSIFLTALREANLAKLVKADVVMFSRLLASLFPNIRDAKVKDASTDIAIKNAAQYLGYSVGENNIVVTKITQLFDLLNVRHSVFVLGPAGSGKSTLLSVAKKALENRIAALPSHLQAAKYTNNSNAANNSNSNPYENAVVVESFDPKAISSFELYGYVQPQTREWKDGILSRTFRDFATNPIYRNTDDDDNEDGGDGSTANTGGTAIVEQHRRVSTSGGKTPTPPPLSLITAGRNGSLTNNNGRRVSLGKTNAAAATSNNNATPSSSSSSPSTITTYGLANGGGAQWIVLDGAIDADWIESMNSVMDDNKLLTLANNERIPMTSSMRLIFEITHLQNATPATVSRAGILYVAETDIGWVPMKDRWLFGGSAANASNASASSTSPLLLSSRMKNANNSGGGGGTRSRSSSAAPQQQSIAANNNKASPASLKKSAIPEHLRTTIDILFDRHVDNFLNFVLGVNGTNVKHIINLSAMAYVRSLCDVLEALFDPKTSPFVPVAVGVAANLEKTRGSNESDAKNATAGGNGVTSTTYNNTTRKTVTIAEDFSGSNSPNANGGNNNGNNNHNANFTERVFLWACIWVFGSPIAYQQSIIDYRATFSNFVKREHGAALGLPDSDTTTVFDWCLVPASSVSSSSSATATNSGNTESQTSKKKRNASSSTSAGSSDVNGNSNNSGGFLWARWFDASLTYNVLIKKSVLGGATEDEINLNNNNTNGMNNNNNNNNIALAGGATPPPMSPLSPVYHGSMPSSLEPTDGASLIYNGFIAPRDGKGSIVTNLNAMFYFDPATPLSEIVIPHEDTERHVFFTNLLVRSGKHVMMVGNAGSGKSALVKYLAARAREATAIHDELVASGAATNPVDIAIAQQTAQHVSGMLFLGTDDYQFSTLHLDGPSDSLSVQTRMEEKLEKRVGRTYGPISRKKLIVVVENLNMPLPDKYGSQSALAVLRQHIDKGFWHDRAKLLPKEVVDQQYIATMNPTVGTQANVPDRLVGRFVVLGFGLPSALSLSSSGDNAALSSTSGSGVITTFSTLLRMCLNSRGVSPTLTSRLVDAIPAVVEVWAAIIKKFLPTASSFHYSFTLRDLSRIVQGLLIIDDSPLVKVNTVAMIWLHQLRAVFCDRLSSLKDYHEALQMCVSKARQLFAGETGGGGDGGGASSSSPIKGNNTHGNKKLIQDVRCVLDGSAIPSIHFETLAEDAEGSYAPIPTFGTPTVDCADALKAILKRRATLDLPETNLIFFDQAVENILRVSRVITQPGGDAFIIGFSGSGKRGLAAMASQLCLFDHHPLKSNGTLAEFSSDVARAVMRCVMKGERIVFLISTTDGYTNEMLSIIDEYLLQHHFDVVLDTDSKAEIATRMANELRLLGSSSSSDGGGGNRHQDPIACRQRYISKLVNNLRVIVTSNSNVETLRYFMRRFPSFQTAMQMIHFHEWPEEALIKVADSALSAAAASSSSSSSNQDKKTTTRQKKKGIDFSIASEKLVKRKPTVILGETPPGSPNVKTPSAVTTTTATTSNAFVSASSDKTSPSGVDEDVSPADALKMAFCHHLARIHLLASSMCEISSRQFKKRIYVTPKTFLTAVATAEKLVVKKRSDFEKRKRRLEVGLEQLERCGKATNTLRAELKIVKVQVEEQALKTNALLERVEVDRAIVAQQNEIAEKEQERTNKIFIEVNELVAECQADLVAAQPMIQSALAALKTLNKSNLTELKSMGSPPPDVAEVTACVMCLLAKAGHAPRDRSWAASRRMMHDVPRWMSAMESLDFNNIPQECVDAVWKTVHAPHFDDELIKTKSFAASSLCRWVKKVVEYHKVRLLVRPKEDRLVAAQTRLGISTAQLAKVQKKVAALKAKLDEIEAQYASALEEKRLLEEQLNSTEQRMQRAQRLLVSLSSEKVRWEQSLLFLDADRGVIDGDALIAAAFVVYAGPLLSEVRTEFMRRVKLLLSENPFYTILFTRQVRKPFVAPPPPSQSDPAAEGGGRKEGGKETAKKDYSKNNNKASESADGERPDKDASPSASGDKTEIADGTLESGGGGEEAQPPQPTEQPPSAPHVQPLPSTPHPQDGGDDGHNQLDELGNNNSGSSGSSKYAGELDPITTLFSAVEVAKWASEGLPDTHRMSENAAVALSHSAWPLLIDPENQALRWVQGRAMSRKLSILESIKANSSNDNDQTTTSSTTSVLTEKEIGAADLVVIRQTDTHFIPSLLKALAAGAVTLIEGINAETGIDASLQPLLDKAYLTNGDDGEDSDESEDDDKEERGKKKKNGSSQKPMFLTLNDKQVAVHPAFSLFFRTSVASPRFQPEVFSRSNVIDFSVTEQGLQELLLSTVVAREKPELEASRTKLADETNKMIISLLECEDILLEQLSAADGDILQNEKLVRTLESAKQQAIDMSHALKEADKTRILLKSALDLYAPIAARGALVYMCLAELSKVDDMYRYSIAAFSDQYERAIAKTQLLFSTIGGGGGGGSSGSGGKNKTGASSSSSANKNDDEASAEKQQQLISHQQQQRIDMLVLGVTQGIYGYISRSLFTRHRVVLAAALAFSVGLRDGTIPAHYMNFLIKAPTRASGPMPSIVRDWLTERQWQQLTALSDISGPIVPFQQLVDECLDTMRWRVWCDHPTPENERLPGDWKQLSSVEKLMIIRVLRNDRMISATKNFVCETMGKFLFKDYELPLADVISETPNTSPILFILSPGADPTRAVSIAASKHGISEYTSSRDNSNNNNNAKTSDLITISMGQGQEAAAEKAINDAVSSGKWVLLHNVHLMRTWIKALDRLMTRLTQDPTVTIHPKFRLFMSADPIDYFPIALLQSSTKLVDEPPAGLKANFTRAYQRYGHEPWEQSTKPQEYHALVYTLCFFHAVVIERSKFGPAGWNRKYPFNFEDLTACTDVLAGYLEERPRVPWEDLQYVFGQIMYGGHITDPRDSRLCMTYLQRLISPELIDGPPGSEIVSAPMTASAATAPMPTSSGNHAAASAAQQQSQHSQHPHQHSGVSCVPLPTSRSHADTLAMINESLHDEGPRMFFMNPLSENRARSAESTQMFAFLFDVMPKNETNNNTTDHKKKQGNSNNNKEDNNDDEANLIVDEDQQALQFADMIAMLLGAVPEHLPVADVIDRLGTDMTPYQHVFYQECERLNLLSDTMRSMLDEADGALKGTLTMTHDIQLFLEDLQQDRVPAKWLALWGETRRPLASWCMLIQDANAQLSTWTTDFMNPHAVNLQCFFIPIAFLTAIQQETALRLNTELDQMGLVVEVTKKLPAQIDLHAREGCFVYGPSLEGAVWDTTTNSLAEVTNKDGTPLPVMVIKSAHLSKIDRSDCYACPMYATSARFSTYITTLHLKTRVAPSEWVLRGTALILDGAH